MLNPSDIARRKPVWVALSDLWLDTELQEHDLRYMAQVMWKSGYSLAELRAIYLYEVAPVVYINLLSPTGEWARFDPEWLCAEAEKWARRHSRGRWFTLRLKRRVMVYATEHHWKRLEQLFVQG
jgi:hypothetical protein